MNTSGVCHLPHSREVQWQAAQRGPLPETSTYSPSLRYMPRAVTVSPPPCLQPADLCHCPVLQSALLGGGDTFPASPRRFLQAVLKQR